MTAQPAAGLGEHGADRLDQLHPLERPGGDAGEDEQRAGGVAFPVDRVGEDGQRVKAQVSAAVQLHDLAAHGLCEADPLAVVGAVQRHHAAAAQQYLGGALLARVRLPAAARGDERGGLGGVVASAAGRGVPQHRPERAAVEVVAHQQAAVVADLLGHHRHQPGDPVGQQVPAVVAAQVAGQAGRRQGGSEQGALGTSGPVHAVVAGVQQLLDLLDAAA